MTVYLPQKSITIYLQNGAGRTLKRKTIYIRGKYRIQLFTAFRVLNIISGAKEVYEDGLQSARIEIRGVEPDDWFISAITKLSPVPVEIVRIREEKVVPNGVVP